MSYDEFKILVDSSNSVDELVRKTGFGKKKIYRLIDLFNIKPVAKCKFCGSYLESTKKKYCNDSCKYRYNTMKKICPICKKEFAAEKGKKYCSSECKKKAINNFDSVCIWCGTKITSHSKSKYCSRRCKDNALSKGLGAIQGFCKHCGEFYIGAGCFNPGCIEKEAESILRGYLNE